MIPEDLKIDFIKIDVEGAEHLVLQGGKNILLRSHPFVIFEYGLGASEYYGTTPETMFTFFDEAGYGIFLIGDFLKNKPSMDLPVFSRQYHKKLNYYFVAAPR